MKLPTFLCYIFKFDKSPKYQFWRMYTMLHELHDLQKLLEHGEGRKEQSQVYNE